VNANGNPNANDDLVEALSASGLVCAVGAGGKKTTCYTLSRRLDRAVVTATVRIPVFDDRVARVVVTDDPVSAVKDASDEDWPLGLVPERYDDVRYAGYENGVVADLAESVDVDALLVKADGARNRLFKAPGDREPQVPENADTVLPIASARAVGEPLDEATVHRPERVARIADLQPGEEIRPEHVARVLASEGGGRKDVPEGATAVPVVNMCDDEALAAVGREVATRVLDLADVPRVVLTRLDLGQVVEVVR
jgi:probable selenium-dependent hydroxylase accessory protein YqeC